MQKVYTVSELTGHIRGNLEISFPHIWVVGEVSNVRIPSSGHLYFTLKDADSQLKCVMFRDYNKFLKFELKDGLQVVANGSITVYEKRGDYQLRIETMEPKGQGKLQLAFEQLKEKLEKEGLFLKEYKKPIPLLPTRIGVVTSPTGAAIRDILNIVGRRFSRVEIIINPVRVQGEGACEEIARAIDEFSKMPDIDVIITGRGGGSIEDLWAFNEEIVARSIHACKIPVISAVGHEMDYTISDLTADLRAPTPSAAAELVVAEGEKLAQRITGATDRITLAAKTYLSKLSEKVNTLQESYGFMRFEDRLKQYSQEIDEGRDSMEKSISRLFETSKGKVENMLGRLSSLNPEAVLQRGYSLAFKLPDKKLIKDASLLVKGDMVEIKVAEGSFISRVVKHLV